MWCIINLSFLVVCHCAWDFVVCCGKSEIGEKHEIIKDRERKSERAHLRWFNGIFYCGRDGRFSVSVFHTHTQHTQHIYTYTHYGSRRKDYRNVLVQRDTFVHYSCYRGVGVCYAVINFWFVFWHTKCGISVAYQWQIEPVWTRNLRSVRDKIALEVSVCVRHWTNWIQHVVRWLAHAHMETSMRVVAR